MRTQSTQQSEQIVLICAAWQEALVNMDSMVSYLYDGSRLTKCPIHSVSFIHSLLIL